MCKGIKTLVETYPWLKEVDSCALRCAVFNLEDSFKDFFAKRSGYPVYKNKYNKQSYRTNSIRSIYKGREYNNISVYLKNKIIILSKLGDIKIRGYRNLNNIEGRIVNATIEKETTGKYYVSVIYEVEETITKEVTATSIVGIDLGIKSLITLSDGRKYEMDKSIKEKERRIKRIQKKLS